MRKEKAKVLSKVCGDLVQEAFRHFDKSCGGCNATLSSIM